MRNFIEICFVKNGVLKYKYVIVLTLVLVWMTFFDDNSFIYRIKLSNEISRLEESIDIHNEKIQELRRQKKELLGNDRNLEKFAREKYLMKKDNEDVFIIVDPEEEVDWQKYWGDYLWNYFETMLICGFQNEYPPKTLKNCS